MSLKPGLVPAAELESALRRDIGGALILERFHYEPQSADRLRFDDILGHAQTLGDFPLRKTVDPAQFHYPSTFGRKILDKPSDQRQIAPGRNDALGRWLLIYDVQRPDFRHTVDPHDARASQLVDEDARYRTEKIGAAIVDVRNARERRNPP